MTPQLAKELLPVITAYANGERIQFNSCGRWEDANFSPNFTEPPEQYRIAPKPVTRAWRLDEVPVGAVIKYKPGTSYVGRWLIGGVNESSVLLSGAGGGYSPESLLRNATMLDGSPCGVTEPAA